MPPASFSELESLLVVADKYNVPGLVNYCGKALVEKVDRTTVVRAAFAGHLYNCDRLKRHVS